MSELQEQAEVRIISMMNRGVRNGVFQPPTNKQSLLIRDGILFARQDQSSQAIRAMREKEKT